MTWLLLLSLAAITIASRVIPLALLPVAQGRLASVLDALPAPLFASLATLSLLDQGTIPSVPVVLATLGGLAGSLRRSLGATLVLGLVGFGLGQLFT